MCRVYTATQNAITRTVTSPQSWKNTLPPDEELLQLPPTNKPNDVHSTFGEVVLAFYINPTCSDYSLQRVQYNFQCIVLSATSSRRVFIHLNDNGEEITTNNMLSKNFTLFVVTYNDAACSREAMTEIRRIPHIPGGHGCRKYTVFSELQPFGVEDQIKRYHFFSINIEKEAPHFRVIDKNFWNIEWGSRVRCEEQFHEIKYSTGE